MKILSSVGFILSVMCFVSCGSGEANKSWSKIDEAVAYAAQNNIQADSALSKFGLLPYPYYQEQFSTEVKGK